MAYLCPVGNEPQIDSSGNPLSGGKIYTYTAGTSTAAAAYTDSGGGTPQANPIVLNANGLPDNPIWLTGGQSYKLVIKDSTDVTIRTIDNVTGINDPATASTVDQWVLFGAAPTYVSATSFTVAGDQTATFQPGRRIKSTNTAGTVYSTIVASSFGASTTVTVVNDGSGALDAGLSAVSYGFLSATDPAVPQVSPVFQCRLTKSGANLLLSREGGRQLFINGVLCTIPAAGVTLAVGAAVAGTLYYIYAYMSGATMTLEFSATAPAADATYGHQIKNGDGTRTLVGMARPIAGPNWADTAAQRFVVSFYNRRALSLSGGNVALTGITNAGAERSTSNRAEFLTWADEAVTYGCYGNVGDSVAATGIIYSAAGIDGVATTTEQAANLTAAGVQVPMSLTLASILAVGYHYASYHARTNATATGTASVTNWATVRG
jgi:hypothetical protein